MSPRSRSPPPPPPRVLTEETLSKVGEPSQFSRYPADGVRFFVTKKRHKNRRERGDKQRWSTVAQLSANPELTDGAFGNRFGICHAHPSG